MKQELPLALELSSRITQIKQQSALWLLPIPSLVGSVFSPDSDDFLSVSPLTAAAPVHLTQEKRLVPAT